MTDPRVPPLKELPPPATSRTPSRGGEPKPPPPAVQKYLLQIDERDYRRPISPPDIVSSARARSQTPNGSSRWLTPRRQSSSSNGRPMTPLAPAFDLRQYSLERRRLVHSARPSSDRVDSWPLEYIDLLGGNGRWRQRKALQEWERRKVEEEEIRRRLREEEEMRRRRKVELEARKKKQAQEEERRRQEERERQRREVEERERRAFEEEERKRLQREQQEREWLARQPQICDVCGGSGHCKKCKGSGTVSAVFLVSRVTSESLLQYGRPLQGCDECGGRKQGILGDLLKGNGHCYACGGAGRIAPRTETVPGRRLPPPMAPTPSLQHNIDITVQPPPIPIPSGPVNFGGMSE